MPDDMSGTAGHADVVTLTSRLHVALAAIEQEAREIISDECDAYAMLNASNILEHLTALREKCAQHDAAHAASTAEARLTALVERLEALQAPSTPPTPRAGDDSVYVEVDRRLLPTLEYWSEPVRIRVTPRADRPNVIAMLVERVDA